MFIGYPLISSMISKITPPDVQGGIMGVKEGYGSLAMIIGPIIGGSVVDVIGVEAPLILGALTMLTAFIASLRLRASRSYKDI
jgi:predicted MFS family arabinose efflux permease